jgi:hypothetical protein
MHVQSLRGAAVLDADALDLVRDEAVVFEPYELSIVEFDRAVESGISPIGTATVSARFVRIVLGNRL